MAFAQRESVGPLGNAERGASYAALYRATPFDRVKMIDAGIPARDAKRFLAGLPVDQQVILDALKLKTSTLNRKVAMGEPLPTDEGERVLGLAKLIGQVQAIVEESGDPTGFDAATWFSRWAREPLPAYGGRRPIEYLGNMEGQALVSRTLAQAQAGVYA